MQAWVQRNRSDLFLALKIVLFLILAMGVVLGLVFDILVAFEVGTIWGWIFTILVIITTLPGLAILGNWAPKNEGQDKADHWAELYLCGVVMVATIISISVAMIF